MSNIHGLSFGSSDGKRADDEEFYGGGATSGTAVWRPTNGPQRQQQPQQPGAGAGAGAGAGGPAGASSASAAAGGGDADMRQLIAQARQQAAAAAGGGEAADRLLGTITIYANGFMIGNGQQTGFRDAREAANAAFIASLRRGEVPAELEDICRREWGRDADTVSVNLVDKHTEQYVPPKAKFSFADSKGQQLSAAGGGGGGEAGQQQLAATQRLSRQPAKRTAEDGAAPSTTLQIVTADRKKHRETLSEHTTVAQLYAHVAALHVPAAPAQSFELVAGFPPKVLADGALTIKQAGICGASVQQRSTR